MRLAAFQAALDGEKPRTYCSNCWRMWCTANIQRSPRSCRGKSEPGILRRNCSPVFSRPTEFGFQLLAIVEQHTAMRLRRQTERGARRNCGAGYIRQFFIAEAAKPGCRCARPA